MSIEYRTVLITGASSGIGACFAESLAKAGSDLILLARSKDKLDALAKKLTLEHSRRVEVIVADLATPNPAAAVKKAVDALGMQVDLLINNAGFGSVGAFIEQDAEREYREVLLNAAAVVDLSHAFLPAMIEAGHGAIMNIASAAAFQPMPNFAVYAATKAFVYAFGDGLWDECRGCGVHVMSVCPGPVNTPFMEATGVPGLRRTIPRGTLITAELVVAESLRGLRARRRLVLPGIVNKASSTAARILPRSLLTVGIGKYMRR